MSLNLYIFSLRFALWLSKELIFQMIRFSDNQENLNYRHDMKFSGPSILNVFN